MIRFQTSLAQSVCLSAAVVVAACSTDNTVDAGASASCANPGVATPGAVDGHCVGSNGSIMVTTVDPATCDAGATGDDGGGAPSCPYGDTMFGNQGDDDDCKYHVTWSSTSLCQGSAPVSFTVKATYLGTPGPLSGAGTFAEVFTTTPLDAAVGGVYCDNRSSHIDPRNRSLPMTENPPGTYTGPVYFDQPGQWTVRFHFNGSCPDVPGSPHGHAAFHLTILPAGP